MWASPEARAHSFEGFMMAFGLPYGEAASAHRFRLHTDTHVVAKVRVACTDPKTAKTSDKRITAPVSVDRSAQATPTLLMAARTPDLTGHENGDAFPEGGAQTPISAPALFAKTEIPRVVAAARQAVAQAGLSQAELADAMDRADLVDVTLAATFDGADQADLEREVAEAVRQLSISQTLAGRVNRGDFSRFVITDKNDMRCGNPALVPACNPLSQTDLDRIREDVARDVRNAQILVRESQSKLSKARLSDG